MCGYLAASSIYTDGLSLLHGIVRSVAAVRRDRTSNRDLPSDWRSMFRHAFAGPIRYPGRYRPSKVRGEHNATGSWQRDVSLLRASRMSDWYTQCLIIDRRSLGLAIPNIWHCYDITQQSYQG